MATLRCQFPDICLKNQTVNVFLSKKLRLVGPFIVNHHSRVRLHPPRYSVTEKCPCRRPSAGATAQPPRRTSRAYSGRSGERARDGGAPFKPILDSHCADGGRSRPSGVAVDWEARALASGVISQLQFSVMHVVTWVQADQIAGDQSLRCDGLSRNRVSCVAISCAARSIASRSWRLAVGETSNRDSAHLRSASAYFASTHAVQGSSGVSLSVIDIRPVTIVAWDHRELSRSRRSRASLRKRRRAKRSAIPRASKAPRRRRGARHSRIFDIQKELILAFPPRVIHGAQVPFDDVEFAYQRFHLLDSVGLLVWA
jgi:hypothetical protein